MARTELRQSPLFPSGKVCSAFPLGSPGPSHARVNVFEHCTGSSVKLQPTVPSPNFCARLRVAQIHAALNFAGVAIRSGHGERTHQALGRSFPRRGAGLCNVKILSLTWHSKERIQVPHCSKQDVALRVYHLCLNYGSFFCIFCPGDVIHAYIERIPATIRSATRSCDLNGEQGREQAYHRVYPDPSITVKHTRGRSLSRNSASLQVQSLTCHCRR